MSPLPLTPFQIHVQKWKDCTRCELHQQREHVVLCRGKLPCDILFVGEGPGDSEDVIAQPFVGPAGKLLDQIILAALPLTVRYALTNLIGCIPYEEGTPRKSGPPPEFAIKACSPRVEEMIAMSRPKLIVAVGNLARDWMDAKRKGAIKVPVGIARVDIVHPSAILRSNDAQWGLAIQRSIITIRNGYLKYVSTLNR